MTPALLLAAAALTGDPVDVLVTVARGGERFDVGVTLLTAKGPLAARQGELLAGWRPSDDGAGPLDALVPDGRLLRAEVVPPSPYAEPLTRALFAALDLNGDGTLSDMESADAGRRLLAKFDGDGDECLTPLEVVPDLLTRESPAAPKGLTARVSFPGPRRYPGPHATRLQLGLGAAPQLTIASDPFAVEVSAWPALPVAVPPPPKSLLRPGREAERAKFEAVAAEVVTLTLRTQPRGWFETLDLDGDGQLSVRELSGLWRLSRLPDFAGATVSLSVSPGSATRPPVRLAKAPPPACGPAWFQALDRNGDGDVSPREFVGTPAQFQRYDADRDGLLDAAEADAGDRKLPKE